MVGVSAEVHVFRRAAEETGGGYGVALSEQHLTDLLLAHAAPPPAPPGQSSAELVRMGFPQRGAEDPASSVFVGENPVLLPGGYTCPRCKARTAELPCKCHVCGLTLISSPHLARSYHHLFPVQVRVWGVGGFGGFAVGACAVCWVVSSENGGAVVGWPTASLLKRNKQPKPLQPFEEVGEAELYALASTAAVAAEAAAAAAATAVAGGGGGDGSSGDGLLGLQQPAAIWGAPWQEGGSGLYCYGCARPLAPQLESGGDGGTNDGPGMVLRCQLCRRLFCFECDAFVHESLHNCPGCECGGAVGGGGGEPQLNGKGGG
jgi:transcription factor Ssl1